MLRHFLNPPNWFTAASILCSVFAIAIALTPGEVSHRALAQGCLLVVFGTVFDLLDGRVARMTNRMTAFGVQLDSLADLISFGVAPAALAFRWSLHGLGYFGVLVAFWYVLCTAFRLARFNVEHDEWPLKGHSQGLTSTMAGFVLVSVVWVGNGFLFSRVALPPAAIAGVVALLGLLMVSSVPYRNFRDMRSNPRSRAILALGVAASLSVAPFLDVSLWFGVAGLLYLFCGLADGMVTAVHFRRVRGRDLVLPDEDYTDEIENA